MSDTILNPQQRSSSGMEVLRPASLEETSQALRTAHEQGQTVGTVGNGTKKSWSRNSPTGLSLCFSQCNALKEHVWQDMTCTIEAGSTWSALQNALRDYGQMVALDPLWPDEATVGGVLATNDSGALRLKYGSLRDLVLGMTLVLPDGTIAKTGGKVVKNVAGYDLHKLMIGSFGTLAVIYDVTFRLHSVSSHHASFNVQSTEAEPLGQLLLQLLASQLSLRSLQMRAADAGYLLDVCLETMDSVLTGQLEVLRTMASSQGLTVEEASDAVWAARQAQVDSATANVLFKAGMLPSSIGHFSRVVRDAGGAAVTQAGGIMTGSFPRKSSQAVAALRSELEAAGGHLTILRNLSGNELPLWGKAPSALAVMQEIKRNFDPKHILNPGRFLHGI